MSQFKCDVELLTEADNGPRNPHNTLWTMLHTTEDPERKDPVLTARWQQDKTNESSYNVLVGHDGKTVRSNDDDFSPWSSGSPGNELAIHVSAIGRAARGRNEWLGEFRPQLEKMAMIGADHHKRYGRPIVWLEPADVAARKQGFTSHANYWTAIGKFQGMDVRTDPGYGFPVDVFLERVKHYANGGAAPAPAPELPGASLDLVLDQLAGYPWQQFPGWPQLGGRTLVDAVAAIGEALKIDGFKAAARD